MPLRRFLQEAQADLRLVRRRLPVGRVVHLQDDVGVAGQHAADAGIEDDAGLVRRDAADVAGPSAPPSVIGEPAGTVNAIT